MLFCCLLLTWISPASADETPKEKINFKKPEGYAAYNSVGNDVFFEVDYVPGNEKSGIWTSQIILQANRDTPQREPTAYNAALSADFLKYCPLGKSKIVRLDNENGFPINITINSCPSMEPDHKPQTDFIKSLKGHETFYFVKYTFRSKLNGWEQKAIIKYLDTITLCDLTVPDPKC